MENHITNCNNSNVHVNKFDKNYIVVYLTLSKYYNKINQAALFTNTTVYFNYYFFFGNVDQPSLHGDLADILFGK